MFSFPFFYSYHLIYTCIYILAKHHSHCTVLIRYHLKTHLMSGRHLTTHKMLTKFSYYYKQNKYASSIVHMMQKLNELDAWSRICYFFLFLISNTLYYPTSIQTNSRNMLVSIILLSISPQTKASISRSLTYATE